MSDHFDLKAVGCKVFSVLTDCPESRDDDKLLLMQIWQRESQASTVGDFFAELLNGKLSNAETITRMRRKLQEKHKVLRGEKWDVRHNVESVMCEQLTFFDMW